MSCFVIDKKEYIKAAGLMYGIESTDRCPHSVFLRNVLRKFKECYRLNVESVAERYNEEPFEDGNEYPDLFEEYKMKGTLAWLGLLGSTSRTDLRKGLLNFFESVEYQVENEWMNRWVKAFLYDCIEKLTKEETSVGSTGWWGKVGI